MALYRVDKDLSGHHYVTKYSYGHSMFYERGKYKMLKPDQVSSQMAIEGTYDLFRPMTETRKSDGWLYDKKQKYPINLETFYSGKPVTSDTR